MCRWVEKCSKICYLPLTQSKKHEHCLSMRLILRSDPDSLFGTPFDKRDKSFGCHLTSTYLFTAEVTLQWTSRFTSCFVYLWENIELTPMDCYWESGGFPTTPKLVPQLDPFPSFGGSKKWKYNENCNFHVQMKEVYWEVIPINNFSL